MRLSVDVKLKGAGTLEAHGARLRDSAPFFDRFIDNWVRHNEDKFERAKGRELTGVTFDNGAVLWQALTPASMLRKVFAGFPDWLMVEKGDLRQSLIQRGASGWREEIGRNTATFGSILDVVEWQSEKRPSVFLDSFDIKQGEKLLRELLANEGAFHVGLSDS